MTTTTMPILKKPKRVSKCSEDIIYKYMKENYLYCLDFTTKRINVTNLAEATALFLDDYDEHLKINEIYFKIAVKVAQETEIALDQIPESEFAFLPVSTWTLNIA